MRKKEEIEKIAELFARFRAEVENLNSLNLYDINILCRYLQPIINQYFVNNKSEIWLWSLMIHSKGHRFNGFINS